MTDLYYNFTQYNNSENPVLLDKTESRTDILIERALDYKLAVVKFNLPAANFETFLINNDTDYAIKYSFLSNDSSNAFATLNYTQPMYQSSVNKMYSVQDFLENFNRSSLLCHKGLLDTASSVYTNLVISRSVSGNNSGTAPAFVDLNYDYSTGISASELFVSYVELTLNVRATSTLLPQQFEIQLIDPNGLTCIVTSNKQYVAGAIEYEDGSIYTQSTVINNQLTQTSYQPIEPFNKFSTSATSQKGTWKVRILNKNQSTSNNFNITYSTTLKLYFAPRGGQNSIYFPRIAPALTTNAAGDTLELIYADDLPRSGFQIQFSPRLYQLLSFQGVKDGSFYIIKLPQTHIDNINTLNLVSYPQSLLGSAYKLLDICEIQIRSNTLYTNSEISATSRERIITSINVSSGDLMNSNYEYYNPQLEDRSYQLMSGSTIVDVNLSVYVRYRSNNTITQVYLAPYTTFNCLLKFIKV